MSNSPLDSIVIGFGAGVSSDALAVAELDETMNRDAAGAVKNDFGPKEPFYFWVHLQPGLTIAWVRVTAGMVIKVGTDVRSKKLEWSFFPFPETTIELGHIPTGRPSAVWHGRNGQIKQSGRTISAAATPAVGDVSYSFPVTVFKVTPPRETESLTGEQRYPVGVAIWVEKK